MRFMVLVKSTPETEVGMMPSEEQLTAMGKYNEELVKAGVMLTGEGLLDSSKGAKVRFSDGKTTVVDGPFTEAKELVAGFWIIQVKSREEAIEWVRRIPCEPGEESEVEIRQIAEPEDFGDAYTDEVREQEDRVRAGAEQNAN
jgi:hypothetical protein